MALSEREKRFARVALKARLLDQAQLKEAERILNVLQKAGSSKQLPDVLKEKGFLTDAQVAKINRTLDMRSVACPDCGTRFRVQRSTTEGQVRCPHCRAVVVVPPGEEPSSSEAHEAVKPHDERRRSAEYKLVCLRKGREPVVKSVESSSIRIGRTPDNDLTIADSLVSKHHAEVTVSGGEGIIRDCASRNGTMVNGEKVEERPLHVGDLIEIGAARLLFLRAVAGNVSGTTATGGLTAFDAHCRLTGVRGSKTGHIFPLGSSALSVGSDPSNSIVLIGDDASKFHAHIAKTSKGVRVVDLFSPSGIVINGSQQTHALLNHGDILSVGAAEFRFDEVTGETDALQAAAPAEEPQQEDEPTGGFELTEEARNELALRTSRIVAVLQDEAQRVEAQFGATGGFTPQFSADSDGAVGKTTEEDVEAELERQIVEGHAEPAAPREEPATNLGFALACIDGPNKGETYPLPMGETTIGRLRTNPIAIRDPAASRHHAKLIPESGAVRIVDLNSHNGVEVNGKKIREALVRPGDTILIGKTVFVLRFAT